LKNKTPPKKRKENKRKKRKKENKRKRNSKKGKSHTCNISPVWVLNSLLFLNHHKSYLKT